MIIDIDKYILAATYTYKPSLEFHPLYNEMEKELLKGKYDPDAKNAVQKLIMQNTITEQNSVSGFTGMAFLNPFNKEILISYKAKDQAPNDTIDILILANGILSRQYKDALNFYTDIKNLNPNWLITVTGHSFGGTLAQAIGVTTLCRCVTINPYPVKKLISKIGLNPNLKFFNIQNYVSSNDLIYLIKNSNSEEYPGITYIGDVKNINPYEAHSDLWNLRGIDFVKSEEYEKKYRGRNLSNYFSEKFFNIGA